MIEFDCEHCGKALQLDDTYAGRDGWCRACKHMVIVPQGGRSMRVADLPKEEGYERLQRLLQYAATKADKFKIHLAQQEPEGRRVAGMEEALHLAYNRVEVQDKALSELRETEEALRATIATLKSDASLRESALESALQEVQSKAPVAEHQNERIKSLEADLAAAQAETSTLAANLAEKSAALAELQSSPAQAESAVSDSDAWAEERKTLEGALATAQAEIIELQAKVSEQSDVVLTLESTLATTQAESSSAAAWLQERLELEADRDGARAEVEALQGELKDLSETKRSLETELSAAEGRIARFAEGEGEKEILQEKLTVAQEECDSLRSQLEEKLRRIEALEEAAARHTADVNGEVDVLAAECESLRVAVSREQDLVTASNTELETLSAALATAQHELAAEKSKNEALAQAQADLQAQLDLVTQEQAQTSQLAMEQATRLKEQVVEIEGLQKEVVDQAESLSVLRSRHDEREKSTRDQIFALEEQVHLFEELKNRMASLQDRVIHLDQEHLDLTLSLEDTTRKLGIAQKKESSLEARLEEASREKASFLVQVEDLQRENTCKSGQIAQLSEELTALSSSSSSADLDRDKDRRALQSAEETLLSLRGTLSTAVEEKDAMARVLQEREATLEATQSRYEDLESKLAQVGKDTTVHADVVKEMEGRVTELEAALKSTTETLAHQEEIAANAVRDLTVARKTIDALEEELAELESNEFDADLDEESEDVPPFQPLTKDDSEPIMLSEVISDRQRQQERQQMMDVLSDFLDK